LDKWWEGTALRVLGFNTLRLTTLELVSTTKAGCCVALPHGVSGGNYQKLGIKVEATETEINSAFRSLSKTWHPDHLPRMADPVKAEANKTHRTTGFQLILAAKNELLGTFKWAGVPVGMAPNHRPGAVTCTPCPSLSSTIDPAAEKARCKADAAYKERQDEKDKKRKAEIAEQLARAEAQLRAEHAAAEAKRQLELKQQEARDAEDAAKRAEELAKAKLEHAEELRKEEGARLEAERRRRQAEADAANAAIDAAKKKKEAEDALKATPVKALRPMSEAEVSALSPKQLRAELER
jgi:hypothetical protein